MQPKLLPNKKELHSFLLFSEKNNHEEENWQKTLFYSPIFFTQSG
jgi:hypothetical protein